ncbi:hypothetical protein [Miltoncostaea oceani]|uniref:hypothetical protein n=1 Tax=Miltoncostaea oceani TaxID=2843216 RepID=UPI001C3C466C|nr:hypothetical protein [Miltoncostaea oceani]
MNKGLRIVLKKGALGLAVIIGLALAISFGVRQFVDDPVRSDLIPSREVDLQGERNEGGAGFDLFVPESRIPRGLEEELDAPILTLIAERQAEPLTPVAVSATTLDELSETARGFLSASETFTPGQDPSAYQAALARWSATNRISTVAARTDSHQYSGIGLCSSCVTGSEATTMIDPRYYLSVRRIDDGSAYVTTQLIVQYSGVGSPWNGRLFRRSYALIMLRQSDRWVVARAASETLDEVRQG